MWYNVIVNIFNYMSKVNRVLESAKYTIENHVKGFTPLLVIKSFNTTATSSQTLPHNSLTFGGKVLTFGGKILVFNP